MNEIFQNFVNDHIVSANFDGSINVGETVIRMMVALVISFTVLFFTVNSLAQGVLRWIQAGVKVLPAQCESRETFLVED